ncbi:hypothetical protein F5887DRAFT_1285669 [Amanita rubescens]|nr:hypothetical protein F5887DRAFT_1285669 [Amanita rubescens]
MTVPRASYGPYLASKSSVPIHTHGSRWLVMIYEAKGIENRVEWPRFQYGPTADVRDGPAFALFIHRKSLLDTITKLSHIDTSGVQAPANGTPRREVLSIPWSKWGPGISMWLDVGGSTIFWTNPPTGQRWALLYFDSSVGGSRFTIFDFNPYNIHDDDDDDDLSGQYAKARKGDYFSHRNIFAEDVEMGFGCTMYNLPVTYRFQGFLMDE